MQISTHTTGLARLWESTYETPANLSKNRTEFLAKVKEGLYPSVPGPISAAIAAMERLVEIERQASGGVEAYCRSVVDGLTEAGKDLPKDFAAGAVKARELGEQQETTRIATRLVREELDERFPQIVEDNLPGVLAGLRTEVGEILARLPELIKTLDGLDVASPAAAARADQKQREALVALNEDCRRYNELRDCQVAAIRATTLAKQMMTRNDRPGALGEVWEDAWLEGLLEFADIRMKGNLAAGDDVLRFSRLARREDVWVPDLHDVQDALEALHPVGAA